jgi:hypothetical protein
MVDERRRRDPNCAGLPNDFHTAWALRDILRRDATSVATGGIAEVVEQPPFERTTLVTRNGLSLVHRLDWKQRADAN